MIPQKNTSGDATLSFANSIKKVTVLNTSHHHRSTILAPPFTPHALLYPIPNPLHDLPIPPPSRRALLWIPLLDLRARDTPAPPPDRLRHILAPPSDIDPQGVLEQIRRVLPLVALELPRLTRGEDAHDAIPVVRFELLGGVDQDEAEGPLRVEGGEQAGDVQDVGGGEGGVRGDVGAGVEEGFDVGHAEERGGGGGEEDDGVRSAAGLLVARCEGGGVGDGGRGGGWEVGFLAAVLVEDFGIPSHGGEILR